MSAMGAPIGFVTTFVTILFTAGNEFVKLLFKSDEKQEHQN